MEFVVRGGTRYVLHKSGRHYLLTGSAACAYHRDGDGYRLPAHGYVVLGRRCDVARGDGPGAGRRTRDVLYEVARYLATGTDACLHQGIDARAWLAAKKIQRDARRTERTTPAPLPRGRMVLPL